MGLSIGIVGLPNVGKSTVFNALTGAQNAQVANYPFCTIKPNRAIVFVPDQRLDKLAKLVNVSEIIYATVEFVDIAGLVKGASQGEGLGNQFLASIRDTNAIIHVVRCFDDPNIAHISEEPDPQIDIEIVTLELILADLDQIDRKIERLASAVKGDKRVLPVLELAIALKDHLSAGKPAGTFPYNDREGFQALNQELRFLTAKPVIYIANVDEAGLDQENNWVSTVRLIAEEQGADIVVLCAKLEEEMGMLSFSDLMCNGRWR